MKDRFWMNPDWRRILFAAAVGILVMLGVTGGFAWMLEAEILEMEWMSLCTAAIALAGGFTGGTVAGGGKQNMPDSALAGLCIWLMLFGINAALFSFEIRGPLQSLLLIVGGIGTSILVQNRYTGPRKRRSKKRPHR